MEAWLTQVVVGHPYAVYILIAIFAPLHGPIFSTVGGALIKLDLLSFWPLYIALMVGDLIGDTMWYFIGRNFGNAFVKRFGKYFSITPGGIATLEGVYHKHKDRILIISKLTMGFGFAVLTLFTAGLVKIPYKRYIFLNAVGQFFWSGFLIAVGYLFGEVYLKINNILGQMSLIALGIIAFVAFIGIGKYIWGRILQINEQ